MINWTMKIDCSLIKNHNRECWVFIMREQQENLWYIKEYTERVGSVF